MRPAKASGLAAAGPVRIPAVRLACDAIQDETARARCGALKEPPAAPRQARRRRFRGAPDAGAEMQPRERGAFHERVFTPQPV